MKALSCISPESDMFLPLLGRHNKSKTLNPHASCTYHSSQQVCPEARTPPQLQALACCHHRQLSSGWCCWPFLGVWMVLGSLEQG